MFFVKWWNRWCPRVCVSERGSFYSHCEHWVEKVTVPVGGACVLATKPMVKRKCCRCQAIVIGPYYDYR